MRVSPQFPADLFTCTKETINGKLDFLWSVYSDLSICDNFQLQQNINNPITKFFLEVASFYVFHCVKSVHICNFSSSYFPVFGSNTQNYGPEKNSVFEHFSSRVFDIKF